MTARFKIPVECGATTCAREPGKFCRFVGTQSFGTRPVCLLFQTERGNVPLHDENGWLQRCAECLALEAELGRKLCKNANC